MQRTVYRPAAGWRNRALRGRLGDNGDFAAGTEGNVSGGVDTSTFDPGMSGGDGTPYPGYSSVPNSSGGPSGGFWQSLVTTAGAIAAPIVRATTQQAPYFITSPTGQSVLYDPNTGRTGAASTGLPSLGSINPMYLLVGAGLLAVFAFAGKKS